AGVFFTQLIDLGRGDLVADVQHRGVGETRAVGFVQGLEVTAVAVHLLRDEKKAVARLDVIHAVVGARRLSGRDRRNGVVHAARRRRSARGGGRGRQVRTRRGGGRIRRETPMIAGAGRRVAVQVVSPHAGP